MTNILANSSSGNAGPAAAVAASVYDLVAWNNAGTCTLTRDVAWTSVTTPAAGDAFARVNGILVNSVAITNGPAAGYGTYLGTIATDAGGAKVTFNPTPAAASGGPTNGAWVGLWNETNRVPVIGLAQDSKANWQEANSTWQQSDGSANNRVTVVIGQQEDFVDATFAEIIQASAGGSPSIGIGLDSTATPSGQIGQVYGPASAGIRTNGTAMANLGTQLAAGVHYLQALEWSSEATLTYFYGSGNSGSVAGQGHQLSAQLRY
jgi:hypothetical protein